MDKNTVLGFKAYFETLSPVQKKELRNTFLKETECSLPTFYNKKDNPSRFTKLERAVIARITKMDVETLFPQDETSHESNFN
jgi:hypothetical protein